MKAWQIDAMWEAEAAAEWERLNAPDPYEQEMKDAAIDMKLSGEGTDQAIKYLMDAQGELEGTPMADKVGSLIEALEELECDIRSLAEKYGKGERE